MTPDQTMCPYCERNYKSFDLMRKHMRTSHSVSSFFTLFLYSFLNSVYFFTAMGCLSFVFRKKGYWTYLCSRGNTFQYFRCKSRQSTMCAVAENPTWLLRRWNAIFATRSSVPEFPVRLTFLIVIM